MENITEVYVLDKNYQIVDILDDFTTLIWNKKYYDAGTFQLYCDAKYAWLFKQNDYIYRNDEEDTGIIEEFGYSDDDQYGKQVVVKGRFLKATLEDRVIDYTQQFNNVQASEVIKQLVTTFCISPVEADRVIPKLEIVSSVPVGERITLQVTGDGLPDAIERICLEQQISASLKYDFLQDKLLFSVWQGVNRTEGQTINNFATFSEEFENVSDVGYNNERKYKNYAYVAGAGEGTGRIVEIVDIRKAGEPRRELYVDARDLQNTDKDGNPIPEATYRETLRQRGLGKLAEYQPKETIETKIDLFSNLIYKEDYDLGDLVSFVDNETGIVAEQRITEIYEYIEQGERRIDVVLGQEKLSIQKFIKREVG